MKEGTRKRGKRKPDQRNRTHKTKSVSDMERMLAEVADLDRKGWSQTEIGKKVGVSQTMVGVYLKKIRERYKTQAVHDKGSLVERQVCALNDVMKAAWEAFERSKEDAVETVETKELEEALKDLAGVDDEKEGTKRRGRRKTPKERIEKAEMILKRIVTTRRGRLPANEYLTQIRQSLHQIAELKGLYPTEDKGDGEQQALPDWSVFSLPYDKTGTDSVDKKLERMKEETRLPIEDMPAELEDIQEAEFTVNDRDEGRSMNGKSNGETHP